MFGGRTATENYVWNTGTLEWDRMTQPGGGGAARAHRGLPGGGARRAHRGARAPCPPRRACAQPSRGAPRRCSPCRRLSGACPDPGSRAACRCPIRRCGSACRRDS